MNAEQRKRLKDLYYKIDEHRDLLEQLQSEIGEIKDEEEGKLDSLPDSLRESSKGEEFQECIDTLEASMDALEEANTCIYNCFEYLDELL